MLNFEFLEKGLEKVSSSDFVYVSRKIILMLNSIHWPNLIPWLPLLLEIVVNMCVAIVSFPGCDVIDFDEYLSFLSSRFSTWLKSKDKNLNILRTIRAFKVK